MRQRRNEEVQPRHIGTTVTVENNDDNDNEMDEDNSNNDEQNDIQGHPIGRCILGDLCKYPTHQLRPNCRCSICNEVIHLLCTIETTEELVYICGRSDCCANQSSSSTTQHQEVQQCDPNDHQTNNNQSNESSSSTSSQQQLEHQHDPNHHPTNDNQSVNINNINNPCTCTAETKNMIQYFESLHHQCHSSADTDNNTKEAIDFIYTRVTNDCIDPVPDKNIVRLLTNRVLIYTKCYP